MGSPVGYARGGSGKKSHWRMEFNSEAFYVHRVIWCLLHGSIDNSLVVDHKNGDPLDNSYENLRLVTYQTNSQNKVIYNVNSTGFTGVSSYRNRGVTVWVAKWVECGKWVGKSFSTKKYGDQEAFKLACKWRESQIEKLNLGGADYTDRHGKL